MDSTQKQNMSDHDLLIRLDTKVESLTQEIRDANNNVREEIRELKLKKVDKEDFEQYKIQNERVRAEKIIDFEKQFAAMEKRGDAQTQKIEMLLKVFYVAIGIFAVIQFVSPFIIRYYFKI